MEENFENRILLSDYGFGTFSRKSMDDLTKVNFENEILLSDHAFGTYSSKSMDDLTKFINNVEEDYFVGELMTESDIASEKTEGGGGGGGGVTVSNENGNNAAGGATPVDDEYYNYAVGRTIACLKHNPGITLNWSPQDDFLMQELLVKYASESILTKYAKVAQQLNEKIIRDVPLRIGWLKEKKLENRKRRIDDDNLSRKNKYKKEKLADPSAKASSHLTNQSDGLLYAQTAVSMDKDHGISYKAIVGENAQLLKQNAQAMDQISANFRAFKIHDNINLFCQARNNIETVLNDLNRLEVLKRMPPFPEKLNVDLLNNLLPPA